MKEGSSMYPDSVSNCAAELLREREKKKMRIWRRSSPQPALSNTKWLKNALVSQIVHRLNHQPHQLLRLYQFLLASRVQRFDIGIMRSSIHTVMVGAFSVCQLHV